MLLGTVERLQHGGAIYTSLVPGSLVPTETPYFPGSVLLTWAAATLLPVSDGPRILGTLATLAFFAAVWLAASRLTKAPLAAGVITVFGFSVLLAAGEKHQAQSFFPDYLMTASAILAALIITGAPGLRIRSIRFAVLCALLFLIGMLKQSSFAIFAGFGIFAVLPWHDYPRPARRTILVSLAIAGVALLVLIWRIPNCWGTSVTAMGRHPIVRGYFSLAKLFSS